MAARVCVPYVHPATHSANPHTTPENTMATTAADRPRTDELQTGDIVWNGRAVERIEIVSVDPQGSDLRFQGRQPDRTFSHEHGSYIVAREVRTGEERHMHAAPSLRWTRAA